MPKSNGFNQLLKRVAGMLHPDSGDAWLQRQSWQRIVQYSQEEMCELMDAVKQGESEAILDELADVCFHLAIYTALAQRDYACDLDALAERAMLKLNERLLPDEQAACLQQSSAHWQTKKQKKKREQNGTLAAAVPRYFPALMQAIKLREVVAQIGFVPLDAEVIRSKWMAEMESVAQLAGSDLSPSRLGRLLFLFAEYALALNLDAEALLQEENQRYRVVMTELEVKLLQIKPNSEELTPSISRDFYLANGKNRLD